MRIPGSTYRIQFSLAFRFVDGRDLVPYLNDLGITDLYSSPRFKARRGSPHAYDVADPLRINSELGTEEEFQELAAKLEAYGMGLLVDIVPNHMAASAENPWWMDVLENGRASIYAAYVAIDWNRPGMKATSPGKVVLPVLGEPYGAALESGLIGLKLDENGFFARYYDHRFPLDPRSYPLVLGSCREARTPELADLAREFEALPADPAESRRRHERKQELKARLWRTYSTAPEIKAALDDCLLAINGTPEDPAGFDLLDRILSVQPWRLAWWRVANEELNYRRFFDINDLIGVRVEDPEVFDARHTEILGLVANGHATGFRIDHIDGLRDPEAYLQRLKKKALPTADGRDAGCSGFYLIVEKILGAEEELPTGWDACGTTGYDFLGRLNSLFVDPDGLRELGEVYRKFTGLEEDFAEVRYRRKKQVMEELFAGEVRVLGWHLARLASADRYARDLPYPELERALVEVTAWFPVYRSYIRDFEVPGRDRGYIEEALERAAAAAGALNPAVPAFLRRVLLLEVPHYIEDRGEWLDFVLSWQQFTGPVMAKGYEDTACYVYNRLVSSNEVGVDPELAGHPAGVEGFHGFNLRRAGRWPHTLNTTSTHDTKRSEDVRARINVLSELPQLWARRLSRWAALNARHKQPADGGPAPCRNDEALLYQTLLGAWPLSGEDRAGFPDRIRNFMQKAVREAKTHSSWLRPNEQYEAAVLAFIDAILAESDDNPFLKDFLSFQPRIAQAGALNALAQVLLKIASPGVPDFYQGCELWDFSLVDPDNRRPVDFARRAALLDELRRREAQDLRGLLRELTANWPDGRIKLYLTYRALNFRRANAALFETGEYVPLEAPRACAFARAGENWALAVAPRLTACLAAPRKRLLPGNIFGEAALTLPPAAPEKWRNVLTGEDVPGRSLRLADLFAAFPVALLESK